MTIQATRDLHVLSRLDALAARLVERAGAYSAPQREYAGAHERLPAAARRVTAPWILLAALGLGAGVAACGGTRDRGAGPAGQPDTAFAAMQARGAMVMGVDQYTSPHVFEDLPDGGRIVLDRNTDADSAGIARIRRHMRDIATAFAQGDFARPFEVHAMPVPGTAVMAQRRSAIRYREFDRPRGAEVRITTTDTAAVAAVHAFLAFQRTAHHAAAHEGGREAPR